jgi:hypothetical protein
MPDVRAIVDGITSRLSPFPAVEAIAFSGSRARATPTADAMSDVDLYVFTRGEVALSSRQQIAEHLGRRASAQLDQRFWGLSDQWIDAASGWHIDVNYFDVHWMHDTVLRVVEAHQPSLGYTTCFWRTIQQSVVLFDRGSWLRDLKARCDVPYPEELRRRIIAHNHPVLRTIYTSYASQIDKAVARADIVSLNHRIGALLASYFDCLFAANRVLHPGEKRLVEFAESHCRWRSPTMAEDIAALLRESVIAPASAGRRVHALLDGLDAALTAAEG